MRIREREQRVLTLSEQGWTQQAIATEVAITQAAVSKILRRLDERALQTTAAERAHHLARRTRHLEYISREGRRGWEESKKGRVRRRQRKAIAPDGMPVVIQDVSVEESPDPRMLDQSRKAEESLLTLCGAGASPRAERAGRLQGVPVPERPLILQLSTDTLERALADLTGPRPDSSDPLES